MYNNLLIASDLHGSPLAAKRVVALYQRLGARHLLLLGDLLNYGPRNTPPPDLCPARVVETLAPLRGHILCVRGNCDSEVDQMLLPFPLMAPYAEVLLPSSPGGAEPGSRGGEGGVERLFLTHGHLWSTENLPPWLPLGAGLLFCQGHTHRPSLRRHESGALLLNVGSVALPKDGLPPTVALVSRQGVSLLHAESGRPVCDAGSRGDHGGCH